MLSFKYLDIMVCIAILRSFLESEANKLEIPVQIRASYNFGASMCIQNAIFPWWFLRILFLYMDFQILDFSSLKNSLLSVVKSINFSCLNRAVQAVDTIGNLSRTECI